MPSIGALLRALEERTIAREVGIPHDEARSAYALRNTTVHDWAEFEDIIGDYYNYHFTRCVSRGGSLTVAEARGQAKEILEREDRRRGGNITSAYCDAEDGSNGGMRRVLDVIADGLKAQAVERYVRDVFDRHVTPNCWEDKVDIIRQFIGQCGANLSSSTNPHQPERYAHDYRELIQAYVEALRQNSRTFRRL